MRAYYLFAGFVAQCLLWGLISPAVAGTGNAYGKEYPHFRTGETGENIPKQIDASVEGQVTDENGEPLIGVNIQVKGTGQGTSSDFDGRLAISE